MCDFFFFLVPYGYLFHHIRDIEKRLNWECFAGFHAYNESHFKFTMALFFQF